MPFYADDRHASNAEDDSQRALCTLHNPTKQSGMRIFRLKRKVNAFLGQILIRRKIVMCNNYCKST